MLHHPPELPHVKGGAKSPASTHPYKGSVNWLTIFQMVIFVTYFILIHNIKGAVRCVLGVGRFWFEKGEGREEAC